MADEPAHTRDTVPDERDQHLEVAEDESVGASVANTLALLAERLAVALDCWECCIYEYVSERDAVLPKTLWSREMNDDDRAYVGVENHLNRQPHVAPVFAEHRIVVTQADAEALDPQSRESMAYWGEKTALYAPVLNGDELLGVVELVERRERREFDASDLRLVMGLAEVAAVALVNARLYDRLQVQAITDGLTGLFNHRHFYDRLHAEITRSRRYGLQLSLLMLDLDDFKSFNDEFGHQAGDRVLAEVGRIMLEELRKDVDVPCRYGGEEFAVILPHTPAPGAETVGRRLTEFVTAIVGAGGSVDPAWLAGERVRSTIEGAPFPGRGPEETTHITVSVGIATYPDQAGDADTLVGNADKALYVAKHRGKNRVELFG
jgi:diguanylate cyclase (GGDEF)-like protein